MIESTFDRFESIKSLLRRDFGKPHPMQPITDTLIRIITLPDGKKVSDINYGKIVKYTHTKPKPQPTPGVVLVLVLV